MRHYIALIHKDPNSDYGVSFPDFLGCISAGVTLDDARSMGVEALAFHVRGMIEDGEAIPEPSSLEEVMRDPENQDGVAILLPLAEPEPKAVRVNITLPDETLQAIDRFAEAKGFTRSGFLVQAARKAMREDAT